MRNSKLKLSLKSGDIIIIAIILILVVISLTYSHLTSVEGRWVSITVDNRIVKRVLISDDDSFSVKGPAGLSEIRVYENKIWISEAPCPHKYCQSMGKISRSGETLICIPNRLIVKVEGGSRAAIDAVTQ